MYKIVIALLISAFLVNAALNVRADMSNKITARLATIDNIAK